MTLRKRSSCVFLTLAAAFAFAQDNIPKANRGYTDTPLVPGQKWHVHDPARPYPPKATPGAKPGDAPSDAIVLFDGKDLSHWLPATQLTPAGPVIREGAPKWKVENGYMEIVPGTGDLATKEKFGNVQLHVEFALPTTTAG
ncbi:MAG TPA: family 16 glycoside hydrolase, partial [Bryobacteraceae bacterium]|nr:family 16 glycoside hydrolase [Bryobacteraceae bacterium]